MPTTATSTRTEGGVSRPSAPVFQVQGAAKEEDVTEEDGSEERSAKESGKEEIYVRDKKNCTTLETFRFRSLLRPYLLYLLQSIYILTTLRFIHHTLVLCVVPFKESYPESPGFR